MSNLAIFQPPITQMPSNQDKSKKDPRNEEIQHEGRHDPCSSSFWPINNGDSNSHPLTMVCTAGLRSGY